MIPPCSAIAARESGLSEAWREQQAAARERRGGRPKKNGDGSVTVSVPKAPKTREALAAAAGVGTTIAQAALTLQKTTQHRRRRGAIRAYLQRAGASLELQKAAAELKLHAERKAGGLLAMMEKQRPGEYRKASRDAIVFAPTLADLGLNRSQSQRLAAYGKHRRQRAGAGARFLAVGRPA